MTRILVVDDDPQVRDLNVRVLQGEGHEVVAAADGDAALEAMRRHSFDAIVLDVIMPDREGIETLLEIRRDYPEMPVLMVSGGGRGGSSYYLDQARKLGANSTLSKPFRPRELADSVAALIPNANTWAAPDR